MSGCGEKSFTSLGEEATMMNTRKWFFQYNTRYVDTM